MSERESNSLRPGDTREDGKYLYRAGSTCVNDSVPFSVNGERQYSRVALINWVRIGEKDPLSGKFVPI